VELEHTMDPRHEVPQGGVHLLGYLHLELGLVRFGELLQPQKLLLAQQFHAEVPQLLQETVAEFFLQNGPVLVLDCSVCLF